MSDSNLAWRTKICMCFLLDDYGFDSLLTNAILNKLFTCSVRSQLSTPSCTDCRNPSVKHSKIFGGGTWSSGHTSILQFFYELQTLCIHCAGRAIDYWLLLSIFNFLYISPLQIINHSETNPPPKLVENVFLKLQLLQFNTAFHAHLKTSLN